MSQMFQSESLARRPVVAYARMLTQSLSQIFFHSVTWTGILMLAAFVLTSWSMALQVLLGAAANGLAARLLGVRKQDMLAGQYGFCGALIGAATFTALGEQPLAYLLAVLGGAVCAAVALAFEWLFAHPRIHRFRLPPTTAPFCLAAMAMYWATIHLHVAAVATVAPASAVQDFFESIFTNVSEVVLIDGPVAGALILLGLFVASWKMGVAALLGSVIDSVLDAAMHLSLNDSSHGLIGYSSVLTAIALAVVFLRGTWQPWVLGAIGAAATVFVTLGLQYLGGPVYTWPYILTTWVFLIVLRFIPGIQRDPVGVNAD